VGQNPVDDVLVLYATFRRIDNDPDRPATATADLDIDGKKAFQALLPRACASDDLERVPHDSGCD
jgi:hypothetical protein